MGLELKSTVLSMLSAKIFSTSGKFEWEVESRCSSPVLGHFSFNLGGSGIESSGLAPVFGHFNLNLGESEIESSGLAAVFGYSIFK